MVINSCWKSDIQTKAHNKVYLRAVVVYFDQKTHAQKQWKTLENYPKSTFFNICAWAICESVMHMVKKYFFESFQAFFIVFDQKKHACACVCMAENNEKHLKIIQKVLFSICVREPYVSLSFIWWKKYFFDSFQVFFITGWNAQHYIQFHSGICQRFVQKI